MLSRSPAGLGGRTNRLVTDTANAMRTVNHGGGTWRLRAAPLRQPQDGAPPAKPRTVDIQTRLGRALISEPEDARLTGGTRSLTRRLSGLNIETSRQAVKLIDNAAQKFDGFTSKIPSFGVKSALGKVPAA